MEEVVRRQFNIGSCLGRGGFGEVYRAKMASAAGLETDVAVKVLRNDLDPAGQAVQRLRDEGRLLARLNHPTILRVYDLVLLEGHVSLVTEFVDGEDLAACFGPPDPIPLRAQLEVLGGVASALDAAWSTPKPDGEPLRLVHRDIKPSNIRISRHGQVKLLDFGIARSDSVQREARTQTNLMVGSPAYMAPERFLDAAVRPESDVFALGCCLYEGLADGERFFHDVSMPIMSGMAVDRKRYDKHLAKRRARVADRAPAAVLELLDALLDYDFEKRPSAADLVHRCEELADQVPGASLGRWARSHGWASGPSEQGPWQGRTITEGTMTRSTFEAPRPEEVGAETRWEPTPHEGVRRQTTAGSGAQRRPTDTTETSSAPRIGVAFALGGLVLGIAVVTLVLAVGGGVVLGGWLKAPGEASVVATEEVPEAPAAEDPVEEPIVEEAPAEDPVPEPPIEEAPTAEAVPEPAPTPAKPKTSEKTASTASTRPARAEPKAEPKATEPAPAPKAATGRVDLDKGGAEVTVAVHKAGKSWNLPADVEEGVYEVLATFPGADPVPSGTVHVLPGDVKIVQCNARFRSCKAK